MVRTDHSPLLWLKNNVGKNNLLDRWQLRLLEFQFDIQHRPGKMQVVADALSWAPVQGHNRKEDQLESPDAGPKALDAPPRRLCPALLREAESSKKTGETRENLLDPVTAATLAGRQGRALSV